MRLAVWIGGYRRRLIATVAFLDVLGVAQALRSATSPDPVIVTMVFQAGLAMVAGLVVMLVFTSRAPAAFQVHSDPAEFRTLPGPVPVFIAAFVLGCMGFAAGLAGWPVLHGTPADPAGVAVCAVIGLALLALLVLCWRGFGGVALTPEGIRSRREFGSAFLPWDALHPFQRRPEIDPDGRMHLVVAHRDRVTRTGWVWRPDRLTFDGVRPAFAFAAIRFYIAHPEQRGTIGTEAGQRHLAEVLDLPPDEPEPAPSTRRIVGAAVGGVLLFGLGLTVDVLFDDVGHLSFGGAFAELAGKLMAFTGFGLLADAYRGITAKRREARSAG